MRIEQLEVAQNKRQNAWQQFQSTKGQTKKVCWSLILRLITSCMNHNLKRLCLLYNMMIALSIVFLTSILSKKLYFSLESHAYVHKRLYNFTCVCKNLHLFAKYFTLLLDILSCSSLRYSQSCLVLKQQPDLRGTTTYIILLFLKPFKLLISYALLILLIVFQVGFFSGRKRESIFKSPEDPHGKVGVTGSGKGLTDFQRREKHLHLKGANAEASDEQMLVLPIVLQDHCPSAA